jgi:hypothetical protein
LTIAGCLGFQGGLEIQTIWQVQCRQNCVIL